MFTFPAVPAWTRSRWFLWPMVAIAIIGLLIWLVPVVRDQADRLVDWAIEKRLEAHRQAAQKVIDEKDAQVAASQAVIVDRQKEISRLAARERDANARATKAEEAKQQAVEQANLLRASLAQMQLEVAHVPDTKLRSRIRDDLLRLGLVAPSIGAVPTR